MTQTWAQKAEENIELFTNIGKGAEAARLLEITQTNRILVDRDQAVILQVGRILQRRFMSLKPRSLRLAVAGVPADKEKINRYQWLKEIFDNVEYHQATIDGKTRSDFKEVAIAQNMGMANKLKGEVNNMAVR
jgi:hypothetical protein